MASRGLIENISYSFVNSEYTKLFSDDKSAIRLLNPISEDLSDMRTTPLVSLINNYRDNRKRGFNDVGIFEIGPGFTGTKPGNQILIAAGLRTGIYKTTGTERHWQGNEDVDIFDVKADILSYLDLINLQNDLINYEIPGPNWFHPGRSANIISNEKNLLASFGEIHPRILSKLNLPLCVGFELYLENITVNMNNKNIPNEFNFSNLQSVKRDFSFDIPHELNAEIVINAVKSCNESLIEDIKLFDQFILNDGKKSLAIEITIQPKTETLTDDEIDGICKIVINKVEKSTGGKLRSQ